MSTSPSKPPRSRYFGRKWIVGIWLTGWLAIFAIAVIAHTDLLEGLLTGVIGGAIASPFALILSLVLGRLGLKVAEIASAPRFQTALFALFSCGFWVLPIGRVGQERLHPGGALKRWTGVAFPRDAKVRNYRYTGGAPVVDDSFTFLFSCSAGETDRLIRELGLSMVAPGMLPEVEEQIRADGWQPAEVWVGSEVNGDADYLELITDTTRTKVYLIFGAI